MQLTLMNYWTKASLVCLVAAFAAACERSPTEVPVVETVASEQVAPVVQPASPIVSGDAFASTTPPQLPFDPVGLIDGRVVQQSFANCGPLLGIRFPVVTWAQSPSKYTVAWELKSKDGSVLGGGQIDTQALADWQTVNLGFAESRAPELSLTLSAMGDSSQPIGIPVATPINAEQLLLEDDVQIRVDGALELALIRPAGQSCGETPAL
jgi:hypothetical protein